MAELTNHIEVYKLLPKTNCRDCGLPTCLAFAAMVIQQTKKLSDCPHLDASVLEQHAVAGKSQQSVGEAIEDDTKRLEAAVAKMDLDQAAARLGVEHKAGRLRIGCLSKDFWVDANGKVASGCHVNGWVAQPLLRYVAFGQGLEPTGEWVALRDLKGGLDWARFFEHRCEKSLARLVDGYTNLFEDLIDIFDAQPAPEMFDSDIAVVIHPLPKLPVLICYWKPEEGMSSSLNIFFDRSAEQNLGVEFVYRLCMGLVVMFEKIAQTHGK